MKILWQEIFTPRIPFTPESGIIWEGVKRAIDNVKSPDTRVDQGWLDRSSDLNWYPYLEMINDLEIIDKLIQGERNGYDAAVIGCYCDPGLHAARGVVDIPVIGLSEAAMMVAQSLGGKFACVTVWENYVPIMERNLRLYGWENRAIANRPIRHFEMDWDKTVSAFKGDGEALSAQFEEIALGCIEDGADVVISGCGYTGPALNLWGYRQIGDTLVPVVDCVAAGITMAETMVRLRQGAGLSTSRGKHSPYPTPARKPLDTIRKRFGFGENT